MNYLNHIPWDIASLAVAVIVFGVLLYFFVGKKVGIQVWKGSANAPIQLGKQSTPMPPPLPAHPAISKDPTQYLLPELGSEGAASVARESELKAGFSGEALLKEIEKCYRSIMEAFNERKVENLKTLLGEIAFNAFREELEGREERNETSFSNLRSIESLKLVRLISPPELPVEDLGSSKKRVVVEISSWQINGVKDASGHLIFGTQGLTHFFEKWLFEEGDSPATWRAIAVEAV